METPKTFTQLGINIIIGLLVGALIAGLIWFISNEIKKKELGRKVKKEIVQKELTFPSSWYVSAANVFFAVMDGASNSEAPNSDLFDIFEDVNTQSDVLQLIKAYGVKQLKGLMFDDGDPKNLIEALASEKLLDDVKEILAKKGLYI